MSILRAPCALGAVSLALLLAACNGSDPAFGGGGSNVQPGAQYDVTVTRTTLGIPHILASGFGSLGYGYGYAFAEDNLCTLQDDLVTIRGERAKYFGRAGTYSIPANRSVADNVSSDFFWKFMATDAAWQHLKATSAPELVAVTQGFVDGYNRYIGELKNGKHPGRHAACAAEPWLLPISEADMYRRYYRLSLIASSSVFVQGIANLAPPPTSGAKSAPASASAPARSAAELGALLRDDPGELGFFRPESRDRFGSNMYAIGPEGSANGMPIVFGNPHFPWTGTERLYIAHATIPGTLDIMGASLYGVPAINIGFNDHVAWSHTVSTAYRFTIYELSLNPSNPLQYLYDGAFRDMEAAPLTIEVKEADGSTTTQQRTLYRTHYGPMMTITTRVNGQDTQILPWTTEKAYTMRDVNAENDRLLNQFAKWNQARSLDEFIALHKSILGIPWVNTVASGPGGQAYYGDVSVVPNVPDDLVTDCAAHPVHDAVQQVAAGLPVLDGSRADCAWRTDADAPAPGMFGAANLPTLTRDDWVTNCNDSYWLTNPAAPVEGYARIIGAERSARTLRTRLCTLQALRRMDGSDGRDGNRFDLANLKDIVLGSAIYSEELARQDVIDNICPFGTLMGTSGPADVSAACAVLADWDGKANVDSVGAHIWREFARGALGNPGGAPAGVPVTGPWLTPFNAADPVNTPRDLNVALPSVQQSLADAVNRIEAAGFALDAPLGTIQHPRFIDPLIPIFGGEGFEGAFTIVSAGAITEEGYGVSYGNSYIQAVTWEPDGAGFKPHAEGFITYSESTDPASPHFSDFTREYSAKRWLRFPFRPAEIQAQKISELRLSQ